MQHSLIYGFHGNFGLHESVSNIHFFYTHFNTIDSQLQVYLDINDCGRLPVNDCWLQLVIGIVNLRTCKCECISICESVLTHTYTNV